MPSDSNGNYSLPSGYLAVTGQTIQPSEHNPPLEDVAAGLTARLMRSGAGPMTGTLKLYDGSAGSPAMAFASALTTGWFKTANGYGFGVGGVLISEITGAGFFGQRLVITGAADNGAGAIRLTLVDTSVLDSGEIKIVSDVTGTTEANGGWQITVIDSTHIDLIGSAFANVYVSGGYVNNAADKIKLGVGLQVHGTTLQAPAVPPSGSFKKLSIKVASNTTVTVAADFVTMTDGTNFQTLAISGTINLGTTGANALDTGTIAIDTWYAIWAIAKADGTTGVLASTSATAPTMPTGYTYKARIGYVQTIHSTATLYGTWQFGRKAQYVVGLAQTANLPTVASGALGTYSASAPTYTTASTTRFVPPTASEIGLNVTATYANNTAANIAVAPNGSYGGAASSCPPPFSVGANSSTVTGFMVLEASTIAVASSGAGGGAVCSGWVDNI